MSMTENVIDWQRGIKKASGNKQLARYVFNLFVESLPDAITTLDAAYNSQEWGLLQDEACKLYSGAVFCAITPRLATASEQLYRVLRSGTPATCEKHYQQLIAEIQAVSAAANKVNVRCPYQ